jgi:hypothetical protein
MRLPVDVDADSLDLMTRLFVLLYEFELADVADVLEHWIVQSPGVLLQVADRPRPAFRLSEYGELTMRELVAIAEQTGMPPQARRTAIGQVMCLAGYARPTR